MPAEPMTPYDAFADPRWDRTPVTSSNIAAVAHDPATNTLRVEFRGGAVYDYPGVTVEHFGELQAAKSVGKHFHSNIRPLAGVKVEAPKREE